MGGEEDGPEGEEACGYAGCLGVDVEYILAPKDFSVGASEALEL